MKRWMLHPLFLWALRVVIGGIFIYAGSQKIIHPVEFADNIAQYQLLGSGMINLVAIGLPVLEVLAGLLFVTGRFDRLAGITILGMCLVFGAALIWAILRGLEIDCGCFGSGEANRWSAWWALGRDILMMAGTLWIYVTCVVDRPVSQSASPLMPGRIEDAA